MSKYLKDKLIELKKYKIKDLCTGVINIRMRDSVVCIATEYGLKDRVVGVRVPVGQEFFLSTSSRPTLEPA
jgi:phage host-nuclease inhibitor protein Gam